MAAVTVDKKRLDMLERKERAHDDYLEAIRRLRECAARVGLALHSGELAETLRFKSSDVSYAAGYRAALSNLTQLIVDVGHERPVDG